MRFANQPAPHAEKVLIITVDGRTLTGTLISCDQVTNLVLKDTVERWNELCEKGQDEDHSITSSRPNDRSRAMTSPITTR